MTTCKMVNDKAKSTRIVSRIVLKPSPGFSLYLSRQIYTTAQDEAELNEHHGYCYRGDTFWPKPTLILPAAVISYCVCVCVFDRERFLY